MSYRVGGMPPPGNIQYPYPQMAPNRSSVLGQHLKYLHSNIPQKIHQNPNYDEIHIRSNQKAPNMPKNMLGQMPHIINRPPSLISHAISPPLTGPSKGLLNGPGQNNCFLNCAVQVSFFLEIYFFIIYYNPKTIT